MCSQKQQGKLTRADKVARELWQQEQVGSFQESGGTGRKVKKVRKKVCSESESDTV
jgi:hypothetical protein